MDTSDMLSRDATNAPKDSYSRGTPRSGLSQTANRARNPGIETLRRDGSDPFVPELLGARSLQGHRGRALRSLAPSDEVVGRPGPRRDRLSPALEPEAAGARGLPPHEVQAQPIRRPDGGDVPRILGSQEEAASGEGEGDPQVKRAVIYVRVSSREQAESGYSLDAQIEACRRFVAEQGWTCVGEFVDAGESAKTADRPNFQNMLTQLDADRGIGYVVVHKIDRFARNLDDHVAIRARFKTWGVRLVSATEGFEDTPTGRMLEGIVASIAGWYSENLGVEVKKGMYQKARSGGWPTFAPIGYKNVRVDGSRKAESKLVIDEEVAPLIRQAFELYATGDWSLRRLHAEMTRRGLRTPKAKPFSVSKLAETLQHDVYAGMVTWGGETHPGIHDPLISMDTFRTVQKIFREHDKAGPRIGGHTTCLNGSLVCATCGSKLSVTLAKGRFPYFFCQGRARQGKDCRERYVPVEGMQRQVEII